MNVFTLLFQMCLNITEPSVEAFPGFAQRCLRIDIEVPSQTREGKKQIAQFMFLLLWRTVSKRYG